MRLAREGAGAEYRESRLLGWVLAALPHTDGCRGGRLVVREQSRWLVTPVFAVAVALGTADLFFTLDSFPAVNDPPFQNGGRPVGWAPEVPVWVSLGVIALSLAVTAAASLWVSARGGAGRAVSRREPSGGLARAAAPPRRFPTVGVGWFPEPRPVPPAGRARRMR